MVTTESAGSRPPGTPDLTTAYRIRDTDQPHAASPWSSGAGPTPSSRRAVETSLPQPLHGSAGCGKLGFMHATVWFIIIGALLASYAWERPNHVGYAFLAWMGFRALR